MTTTVPDLWSRATVFSRHGVPDEPLYDTAHGMARRLAKYLTSASTIRCYVLNSFGHAPELWEIERMMRERKSVADAERTFAADVPLDRDAIDFRVRSTFPPVKKPAPRPETPPIAFRPITLKSDIIAMAEECCGVPAGSILGPSRSTKIVRARFLAATILVMRGGSFPQTARDLGRKDHSVVCNGIRKFIERDLDQHENLRLAWERYAPESLHAVRSYDEFMVAIGRRVA